MGVCVCVCVCAMEYHSAIKKEWRMPFAATQMDWQIVILREESQRRRNILWHPLHAESKKKWYKWIYLQNRKRLTDLENELMVAEGKDEGKWQIESWMNMYTLLYLKWITNKDLLYSTWDSIQRYVAAWMGGKFGGEWIHVYVWLSTFAVHLKLSQYC